ncbi:hypothetical protein [Legionella londiniensis]|uniref:hypothetical protein n=1 Tax=Legionella londiniensis TaxID=45068 RepID=UPI0007301D66|nr:hypothetical protein [Legionella londiniensis]
MPGFRKLGEEDNSSMSWSFPLGRGKLWRMEYKGKNFWATSAGLRFMLRLKEILESKKKEI